MYVQANLPGPDYNPFTFIWILSGVFGAIIVFSPLLIPRRPDRNVIRINIVIAAFHMWLVWVVIYSSQMYPVNHNVYRNTTLVWISYKWGNAKDIQTISLPPSQPGPTLMPTPIKTNVTKSSTTSKKTTPKKTTPKKTKPSTSPSSTCPLPPGASTTSTSSSSTTEGPTPPPPTTRKPSTFANGSLVPTKSPSTATFYYEPYMTANENEFFKVYKAKPDRGVIIFSIMTSKPAEVTLSDQPSPSKGNRIICSYGVKNRDYRIERLKPFDTTRSENGVARKYIREDRFDVLSNKSYKRFYLRWRDGTFWMGDDYFFLTPITKWKDPNVFPINYVSFYSNDVNAKWFIERGVESEFPVQNTMYRRYNSKDYLRNDRTNQTSYTNVNFFYKFHYIRSEPIWISVDMDDAEYRQFFVLLSRTYIKVKPYLLIHIGGANGKQCTISKNAKIVARVNCGIEWRKKSYINFWIWFKRGQIDVYAGYDSIDSFRILSWTDPDIVMYKFYGLRTSVGEYFPMLIEGSRQEED